MIGKGDKERTLLLARSVWEKIVPFLDQEPSTYLFPSRKGCGLKRRQILTIVKRAAIRAGVTDKSLPHFCRHASASHSLDNGAPLSLVQAGLGHASIATTGKYLHAKPSDGASRYLKG